MAQFTNITRNTKRRRGTETKRKMIKEKKKEKKKKQVSELVTLSFSLITREMTAHYNAVMIAIEAQEEEEVEKK